MARERDGGVDPVGAQPGSAVNIIDNHSADIARDNLNTGIVQNGFTWSIPAKTTATVFMKGPMFYLLFGFIPIPIFTSETIKYFVLNGQSVKGFWLRQYIFTGFIPTDEQTFRMSGSTYSGYAFIIKLRIHNPNNHGIQIEIKTGRNADAISGGGGRVN